MDGLRRPLWLRLIAAALTSGVAIVASVASFWSLVFGAVPLTLAALAAAVLSLLAMWPVLDGRWARGALVALQGLAVAVVLLAYAGAALLLAALVREGLRERAVHATPADALAFWTALALGAVVAAVVVTLALPGRRTRRLRVAVVGMLAASGLLGAGVTVAIAAGGDPCDGYRFDRSAWEDDDTREGVGEALARCGTLRGMHRDEVDELLGGPFVNSSQRSYTLDVSTDAMGFPHYVTLVVTFDDDQRMRSAGVERHHG